jgi:hypothetical protein
MTKEVALAARTRKDALEVVRQMLKETQELIHKTKELALAAGTPKDFYVIVPDEKPFNLMGLPYDVRHGILERSVGTQNLKVFLRGNGIPIFLPAIARAGSKRLRRECLLVVLKQRTIEIHSGPGNAAMQKWLSKIDFTDTDSFLESGFDAITSLSFPYFSRFPYASPGITKNNDVGLAMACKNLRSLRLDFNVAELIRIEAYYGKIMGYDTPALAIRQSYQLDGLLNAASLEKLHFYTLAEESHQRGLAEVVAWFEEGFKERNQKVVIKLGCGTM